MDEEEFVAVCCDASRRSTASRRSMGRRIHELCVRARRAITTATASSVWADVADGAELYARLRAPARLRRGEVQDLRRHPRQADGRRSPTAGGRPPAPFGDDVPRSVADIDDAETLGQGARMEAGRQKAAKRDKQDRPMPT